MTKENINFIQWIIIFIETVVIAFFLNYYSKARFRKKFSRKRKESKHQQEELLRHKNYDDTVDLMSKPIKKISMDWYHLDGFNSPLIINYLIVETDGDQFTFRDINRETAKQNYPLLHTFIDKALNVKDNEIIMD